jgi:hypothetical protein
MDTSQLTAEQLRELLSAVTKERDMLQAALTEADSRIVELLQKKCAS